MDILNIDEVTPHPSTENDAVQIANMAVSFVIAGSRVENSVKQAFHILNESRRFMNNLQQHRLEKYEQQKEHNNVK